MGTAVLAADVGAEDRRELLGHIVGFHLDPPVSGRTQGY
jgi:hypothetical protein